MTLVQVVVCAGTATGLGLVVLMVVLLPLLASGTTLRTEDCHRDDLCRSEGYDACASGSACGLT